MRRTSLPLTLLALLVAVLAALLSPVRAIGLPAPAAAGPAEPSDPLYRSQNPIGPSFTVVPTGSDAAVTVVVRAGLAFVGDAAVGYAVGDQVYTADGVLMHDFGEPVTPQATGIIDITGLRWTNATVPYVYDANVPQNARDAFEAAARDFAARTRVRVVPRTNQVNYVRVIRGDGCYSYVGMTSLSSRAEGQPLSLGPGCESTGIARHELGHAVGLHHEHQRIDRDQYVTVNQTGSQYGIISSADNRPIGAYDFESMMHYRNYLVNGRWIFESRTGFPNDRIGNDRVNGFTAGDLSGVAALYGNPDGGGGGGGAGVSLPLGRTVSFQVTNGGLTDRFLRHRGGAVRTDVVTAASSALDKQDASFRIVAALDGTPCYSFESVNFPGEYLRHIGFRLRKDPLVDTTGYRQDATWCAQTGLANGSGISMVSRNLAGHYIRHRSEEVWLDARADSALYRQDATWNLVDAWSSGAPRLPTSDQPDLGPHVRIFDSETPTATIQGAFDQAFNAQLRSPTAQFGTQRHAFLFKPGSYGRVWANLGFYTSVAGLGRNPDDVTVTGALNVDSGWNWGDERNATQNFWRSAENLAIVPEGGTNRWAVSQAAPMRRIHVRGDLTMAPSNQDVGQGYSSGGYLADSVVDGTVSSGSQQQWYTRDSRIGRWEGGVWNMVYSGVQGAPPQAFPSPPHTTLATTPVTREKPYLYVDGANYRVFVPALRRSSAGATWPNTPGTSIPMREFYVVRPGDGAGRINAALAQGLHLFFTPGTYPLDQTIRVTQADTVVTGIGYPTLVPQNGIEAMDVADVGGIKISGLTFDAGTTNSPTLMTVGRPGVHTDHGGNPISLQDVFFRVGSSIQGKATVTLAVHADDTILDHIWAWRADHGGAPTGWTVNTGDTGLLVTGDDVLATGLFVEHYQKYEVIWNGNRGRTIFFQNEKPYDVPDQASWIGPRGNGYAAYKVGDAVTDHELWGGGVYCFFNANPSVRVDRAFEVPNRPGVRLRSVLTVSLGDVGTIGNVVNDVGGAVPNPAGNSVPRNVVSYP